MSDEPSSGAEAQAAIELPADLLFAPEQDMWVRVEGDGTVTVGATHIVAAHGQFMLFTPRAVGTEVERDRSLGVMETAKTAVAVHAPLSGRIVAINEAVVSDVALVAREPYGAGWLVRLQPAALADERGALMAAADYATWLAPRLAQKQAAAAPLDDDEFKEDLNVDPYRGY
jgi:glycine cleavage system H protein